MSCPAGTQLLGGGVRVPSSTADLVMIESYASTPGVAGTWSITMQTSPSYTSGTVGYTVYATCQS